MTKLRTQTAAMLFVMLVIPAFARAQQQAKASADDTTRLRLDIVLSEYDASKVVSRLPYTLFVESSPRGEMPRSVRMGLKVPIATNSGASQQFQYEDVGTDIDARAKSISDDVYDLSINVDRSSVYSANQGGDEAGKISQAVGLPVVRSFRSSFDLGLRDGQTTEGPSATDPFNGHVLKVSVTLHVVK